MRLTPETPVPVRSCRRHMMMCAVVLSGLITSMCVFLTMVSAFIYRRRQSEDSQPTCRQWKSLAPRPVRPTQGKTAEHTGSDPDFPSAAVATNHALPDLFQDAQRCATPNEPVSKGRPWRGRLSHDCRHRTQPRPRKSALEPAGSRCVPPWQSSLLRRHEGSLS